MTSFETSARKVFGCVVQTGEEAFSRLSERPKRLKDGPPMNGSSGRVSLWDTFLVAPSFPWIPLSILFLFPGSSWHHSGRPWLHWLAAPHRGNPVVTHNPQSLLPFSFLFLDLDLLTTLSLSLAHSLSLSLSLALFSFILVSSSALSLVVSLVSNTRPGH